MDEFIYFMSNHLRDAVILKHISGYEITYGNSPHYPESNITLILHKNDKHTRVTVTKLEIISSTLDIYDFCKLLFEKMLKNLNAN